MRQFLENATGLSIYPLFSFVLFGCFFLAVLLWMALERKRYFEEMAAMPLDEPHPDAVTPTSDSPANR